MHTHKVTHRYQTSTFTIYTITKTVNVDFNIYAKTVGSDQTSALWWQINQTKRQLPSGEDAIPIFSIDRILQIKTDDA